MKTHKNILIAFILNISFSIFEIIGGLLTNSVAIISDAVHDLGDALSIGASYFFEKESKKEPDEKYTYGYIRYSVLGATITTVILLVGSLFVIISATKRIMNPVEVNYNGMLLIALLGVIVNFFAAYFTRKGDSLNQKSVNLHMLEDVLGWILVLIGALIMKYTDISIIDPILSILVALFILINAFKNFKSILNLFLEKTPSNISIEKLKEELLNIKGIEEVHHIHVWSLDGYSHYCTLHAVVNKNSKNIKNVIRKELETYGINHVTIEIETDKEHCEEEKCLPKNNYKNTHHHHHH